MALVDTCIYVSHLTYMKKKLSYFYARIFDCADSQLASVSI